MHSIALGLASIIAAANLGWWGASMMCVTGCQKRSFAQLSVTHLLEHAGSSSKPLRLLDPFFGHISHIILATHHGGFVE